MSRFRFIAAEKANHKVVTMCRVLQVSRSGFYAWTARPSSSRALSDGLLTEQIREVHALSRGTYGAPRVHAELVLGRGFRLGRKRVARLMRAVHLQGIHRRHRLGCTTRDPLASPADDLVGRVFTPAGPDLLWVADITQHHTWQGWWYCAVVIDAYSRRVVGWSMADHLRAELVIDAVDMAVWNRRPSPGLVHHSDHGAQTGTPASRSGEGSGSPGSWGPWELSGMPWTTLWPRASSPPCRPSCWTAGPGPPAGSSPQQPSTT